MNLNDNLKTSIYILSQKNDLEGLEQLFENSLKNAPQNTELWLRLFIVLRTAPLADTLKAIDCLRRILEYDSHNLYALLFYIFMYHYEYPIIDNQTLIKFFNLYTEDKELMAIIELAKAWYYEDQNNTKLKGECLLKSINYSEKQVTNFIELGHVYFDRGDFYHAKDLYAQGLNNIQSFDFITIYSKDISSIELFIDNRYKGTITTPHKKSTIMKYITECDHRLLS